MPGFFAYIAACCVALSAAGSANAVVVPPPLDFVPARGGSAAGLNCGGNVLCVGPSGRYQTIGAALDDASAGATIQVQAGTYKERVVVTGRTITLRGGFEAGFTRRNPAGNETVIDAQGDGTAVALSDAGDSTIDGFTITGGRAKLDSDRNARGSGVRVADSGKVTITNNLITGNDDGQDFSSCNCATIGGGIEASSYVPHSSIVIRGNIIRGNRAHRGGGMAIGIRATIADNLVENNHGGGDHGGGLYLGVARMTVRHNLVRGNTIGDQAGYGWGGGGIFYGPGEPTPKARFEDNRWVGNSAPSSGSGLFIDDDASAKLVGDLFHGNACGSGGGAALYVDGTGIVPTGSVAKLENVTISGHTCPRSRRGAAIFTEGGSRIAVTNSIITGNGGASQILVCTDCADIPKPAPSTIAYSLVGGKTTNVRRGAGMLTGSPGFVNPAGDDFRLAPGSKAIDAGDPSSGRRNIGAY